MAAAARDSSLFAGANLRRIGYCFDPAVFKPDLRPAARRRLGIVSESPCVLFVNASQPRKGAGLIRQIMEAMAQMPAWRDAVFLFAGGLPHGVTGDEPRVRVLPSTHEEAVMAQYFAAADLFVMPSLEDNLPNAIIESLACGTPVAAFWVGGIPEIITQGQNGFLTTHCTAAGMASAVRGLDRGSLLPRDEVAARARAIYSQAEIARLHVEFYQELTHGQPLSQPS
jgi:glycosyltransferase involved in cell wall biosynthesis